MKKIRSRFGAYMMEKGTTTREIIRRKNLTRIIAIVADQSSLPTQHTYWTEFMHQDTPFYDGPERIARKTKMPVIFVSMHRTRRGSTRSPPGAGARSFSTGARLYHRTLCAGRRENHQGAPRRLALVAQPMETQANKYQHRAAMTIGNMAV